MAVTPICTGPVSCWVGTGINTPSFLGYGEVGPDSQIFERWTKVMSDRTGGIVARDKMYQGQEALIFITFAEWNDLVRSLVMGTPTQTIANVGVNTFFQVGSLAITEGASFVLYLVYPYAFGGAQHPTFSATGVNPLVGGYRFFGTTVEFHNWRPGTRPNTVTIHFHSLPALQTATGALILYDNNVQQVPVLPPAVPI